MTAPAECRWVRQPSQANPTQLMPAFATTPSDLLGDVLRRHAARRGHKVPTITTLKGRIGLGIWAWRRWAEESERKVLQTHFTDPEAVVRGWVELLSRNRDLIADAVVFLAAKLHRRTDELWGAITGQTLSDHQRFWASVPVDRNRDAASVCGYLTDRLVRGEPLPQNLAAAINEVLAGHDAPWFRVIVGLVGLIPSERLPAILLVPPADAPDPLIWLGLAGHLLAVLAARCPNLPVALAAESLDLDRYLLRSMDSRDRALLREGLVAVGGLTAEDVARRVQNQAIPVANLTESIQRLAKDGASEELVNAFVTAARFTQPHVDAIADQARSAAERFLFERLESLPKTAGEFALNAHPGFCFGNKEAEVDLLAARWQLAVELDGWYYHTLDPENYRRDRRKDWELQRRGYVVLRFLSDDVVAHFEQILDAILAAIAHCERPKVEGQPEP